MDQELKQHIISLSERYETADFLPADPSSFMHKVKGEANQEAMAFIASCLSYGSRKQFFPKIQYLLDAAQGEVDRWLRTGAFANDIADTPVCYYRLYTHHHMYQLLTAYNRMLQEHGSMKEYVRQNAATGLEAVEAICRFFAAHDVSAVVPKNTASACKLSLIHI